MCSVLIEYMYLSNVHIKADISLTLLHLCTCTKFCCQCFLECKAEHGELKKMVISHQFVQGPAEFKYTHEEAGENLGSCV